MKKIVNLFWLVGFFFIVNSGFSLAATKFDEVIVKGESRISAETIRSISGLFEGQEHSAAKINQGLKNLINSGLFSGVEIKKNANKLTIVVVENPQINVIAIEGNKVVADSEILSVIGLKDRDALDENKVKFSIIKIKEIYKKRAFLDARISAKKIDRGENIFDLVFEVVEGDQSEIESITFYGNVNYTDRELIRIIPSRQKGIFSGLFRTDDYGDQVISRDRDALVNFYKSEGFKDVSVSFSKGLYSLVSNDFSVTYSIAEGRRYSVGDISIDSNLNNIKPEEVMSRFKIKTGDLLDEVSIANNLKIITNFVKSKGSVFGEASAVYSKRESGAVIDLRIRISEKEKKFVERIEINGNLVTTDRVLRREFTFSELDPLVPDEIFKTRENLLSLGFFSRVDFSSKEGSDLSKEVIVVEVEEKPTGSLVFGLGYSTDDDVVGQISLNERNFLGKGQRVQFAVKNGSVQEEYSFGFTEPEFLGRDLSAAIDVNYNKGTPKQNSSVTESKSFAPSLGFNLTESSRMRLDYSFADTTASTASSSSQFLKNEPSKRTTSLIGVNFVLDGRDSIIKPKKGYIFNINSSFAGLGGNREYTRTKAKGRFYYPLFFNSIVLSSEIEAGVLSMNSGTSTSSERFFLGGRKLRGFQYGGVGPRDTTVDESLGGTNFSVSRTEISFPLGLPKELNIYGGIFGELGKVWGVDAAVPSGTAVNLNDSVRSSLGFSLYWSTPIGPLQFNWAYPQDYISGVDKLERFSLNLSTMF